MSVVTTHVSVGDYEGTADHAGGVAAHRLQDLQAGQEAKQEGRSWVQIGGCTGAIMGMGVGAIIAVAFIALGILGVLAPPVALTLAASVLAGAAFGGAIFLLGMAVLKGVDLYQSSKEVAEILSGVEVCDAEDNKNL